jgi:hypothetical protein
VYKQPFLTGFPKTFSGSMRRSAQDRIRAGGHSVLSNTRCGLALMAGLPATPAIWLLHSKITDRSGKNSWFRARNAAHKVSSSWSFMVIV